MWGRAECRRAPGKVLGAEPSTQKLEGAEIRGDLVPAAWVDAHGSSNSRQYMRQTGSWIASRRFWCPSLAPTPERILDPRNVNCRETASFEGIVQRARNERPGETSCRRMAKALSSVFLL